MANNKKITIQHLYGSANAHIPNGSLEKGEIAINMSNTIPGIYFSNSNEDGTIVSPLFTNKSGDTLNFVIVKDYISDELPSIDGKPTPGHEAVRTIKLNYGEINRIVGLWKTFYTATTAPENLKATLKEIQERIQNISFEPGGESSNAANLLSENIGSGITDENGNITTTLTDKIIEYESVIDYVDESINGIEHIDDTGKNFITKKKAVYKISTGWANARETVKYNINIDDYYRGKASEYAVCALHKHDDLVDENFLNTSNFKITCGTWQI